VATRIEIQDSAAQTASSNSASSAINTLTMAALNLDVTAVSGTTPVLDLFLQGSDDDTEWFDVVADSVIETANAAAEGTVTTNARDIADGVTAVVKATAIYKHLPYRYVRIKWIISGTTPSFTFSAVLVGK